MELKSQAHVARMEQMRKELGLVHPPEVEARLAEEAKRKQGGQEQVHVAIWSDKVPAIDEGDEVPTTPPPQTHPTPPHATKHPHRPGAYIYTGHTARIAIPVWHGMR